MTPILCIETSTRVCSVCISDGHTILAIAEDNEDEYTHAEKLNVLIEEVIKHLLIYIYNFVSDIINT